MRAKAREPFAINGVPASRAVVFVLMAAMIFAADLATKSVVFRDLGYPGTDLEPVARGAHSVFAAPPGRDGTSVAYLDGWLSFRLFTSFNRGALWGVGQGYTWLFAALSTAAVIGIPTWLFGFRAARSWWLTVALALILGGTLGNLYDRIGLPDCTDENGQTVLAVRDFLLFTFGTFHWPVFNFADVSLVTGAGMLVIHSLHPAGSHSVAAAEPTADPKTSAAGR
ncbi:MAG TPA: signal peptidase II [Planctomycetaceae bacterium]|jgi:signal peptidase II|nr:signal peptidase II [Planctomycetaceae bacterium]